MSALDTRPLEMPIRIPSESGEVSGDLVLPENAKGLIVFAHGSGSSRKSGRNRYVARILQEGGFGTLLMDLLTAEEDRIDQDTGQYRFDIALLASRLEDATTWMARQQATAGLRAGYFGASTGAAAALIAAADLPERIAAVVSRGGRPDLAGDSLGSVKAPTLLIVGGEDGTVIRLNQNAFNKLETEKALEIVPGATHLFEEPGALEAVAGLATRWFSQYLSTPQQPSP